MPLSTEEVLKLAQGGPLSTEQVKTLAPVASQPTAITSASLAPQTPFTPTPVATTPVPIVPTAEQIINDQYKPLPQEEKISKTMQEVYDLTGQTANEAARRAQLEADPTLQAKRQQVQDLSAQLNSLSAEAKAIPIQIQEQAVGQGITTRAAGGQTEAELRKNAIKALGVSSLLSASQGNLTLALDQVDRAVKAEFEPLKAQLAAKRADLEMLMNDPSLTREEARRAAITDARLKAEEKRNQKLEVEKRSIYDLGTKIAEFGVPSEISNKVINATSFDEAFAIASPYMQDPAAKMKLEAARLDNILSRERIATEQRQRAMIGKPTAAETKAEEKARLDAEKADKALSDQAKAQLPAINANIKTLDSIPTHKGLAGSVGPYVLGRFTPFTVDKEARTDFKATIHQLTGELTLNNLINAKAKGATFGALSEGELGLLARSATKLNDWEVKDEKGNGIGVWDVGEDAFLAEIAKIREFAELDRIKKSGQVFTPSEKSELDQVFSTPSTYQTANFDASAFF